MAYDINFQARYRMHLRASYQQPAASTTGGSAVLQSYLFKFVIVATPMVWILMGMELLFIILDLLQSATWGIAQEKDFHALTD